MPQLLEDGSSWLQDNILQVLFFQCLLFHVHMILASLSNIALGQLADTEDKTSKCVVSIVSSVTPTAQQTPLSRIEERLQQLAWRVSEPFRAVHVIIARDHPSDLHFNAVCQPPVPLAALPQYQLLVMKKAFASTTLGFLHERDNAFLYLPVREMV